MALPKIDVPIYDLELPLSKKKVRYRPFLVKEQRNLMMALESDDTKSIESNIKQVLNNCTIAGDIDLDKLPIVDVEYYFIHLRAKSVGEISENRYRCNNEVPDKDGGTKECGTINDVSVNLTDIEVKKNDDIKDTIQLTDTIMMKMKYPNFNILQRMSATENVNDFAFEMIVDSIDYIHDGEQFYHSHESTREELTDFVESLNTKQFSKLEEFFNNLPKLQKIVEFNCKNCGFHHKLEVEGLENFFV
jgi:T4 bacteriophage base plate protein